MTEERCDVSIIIPVYKRPGFVNEAIESCGYVDQRLNKEVIVIDDGTPESLESAVRRPGIIFRRLDVNSGSSTARNAGIDMARGRYIKFLDSDDVLVADSLVEEVRLADKTRADIVVSGWRNVRLCEDGSHHITAVNQAPYFQSIVDDVLAGRAVPTSSALYRRKTIHSVAWDAELSKLNDWDFFIQAALCSSSIATRVGFSYDWRDHAGPRITTDGSMLSNAIEFYQILEKLVAHLESRNELTVERRKRAAQYLYKELRCLYRFDRSRAMKVLARILELDPYFAPLDEERSRIFRVLGRMGLLRPALEAYGVARRAVDRVAKRRT